MIAPMVETLTEEQYEERYQPIMSPEGSDLWEYADTLAFPVEHVWSVMEEMDDTHEEEWALPGYHVVNILGYNVTTHPHGFEDVQALIFEREFEEDEED